jgi:hypothetical protein
MEALHASTIFWASHLSVDRGEAAVAVCAIATEAEARRRVAAKRMVDVWMLGVVYRGGREIRRERHRLKS